MTATTALRISAVVGCLAVGLGAFGAHGLEKMLAGDPDAVKKLEWWKTAVQYHMIHAVVMLVVSLYTFVRACSWWLMLGGILLFSGTLYAMALGAPRWLGAVTPVGGTLLIVGWVMLACLKPACQTPEQK